MPEIKVELLPHQYKSITSNKKFTLLRGGIGSGKSFTGSHFALSMISESPSALGVIGANSYRQLMDSTLSCFFNELDRLSIPFKYNKQSSSIDVMGTKVLARSMDNYDLLRGMEIGWSWLDESRDMKKEAFQVIIGRLRDKRAKRYRVLLTSSPKGFDWQYDYFDGENASSNCEVINAKSRDNIYLPEGYVDTLAEQYDEKMIQQELEGMIVDISSGATYYAFNRFKHVKEFTPTKDAILYFGMDFNVDPMTAVVGYVEDNVLYIFDEFYLRDGNTFQLSSKINAKYGQSKIIPDSTLVKRSTNSTKTDLQILRDDGHEVLYSNNPFVEDRYNCVNGLFSKDRIIVHPRCKNLIKDLERLTRNNKDQLLSHISDAMGYMCWRFFPIKRVRPVTSCVQL